MDPRLKRIIIMMWAVAGVAAVVLGGTIWKMRSRAASAPPVSPVGSLTAVTTPQASSALPVLFNAPTFALTDQNGQPFDTARLRGKVWVADFVFTHCAGICPMMTKHLADFQKA